jgi:UDP-hydrolysing UDP-N-acetyl-D-glucosamine 2-epimerase
VAQGFAAAFARDRPDLVLFVGDRLELLGVAGAALPFRIPLAHVSGGDVSGGAIDDLVRNALSKLAHLHFVAMPEHAERLVAMGEERWRITVSGDPALDDVAGPWPEREALERELGARLEPPVVVVGFHPATLGSQTPGEETDALLAALEDVAGTLVFTYPGADTGADEVIARIEAFTARRPGTILRRNLGQQRYYTLLAHADLLVGNTSSGIWEAPSFRLPVVNVGDRQRGRRRAANVVDTPAEAEAIAAAVARALDPAFRRSLEGLVNPYGDGRATERILAVMREAEPARLLVKTAESVP